MVDIALESVRAAILLGIVVFLWDVGRNKFDRTRDGWNLIVGGFGLLLFGSLMDISDNFEGLNFLVVVGDTEVEAFLEKFVGFLGGFVVVAVGLVRWIPSVQRLNSEISQRKQAENALRAAHDTLEQRVRVRTVELEREIDERKRAEEAFSRKSALLEMTFESMSQGIVVYDADFRLTAFNQHYADLYRYPSGFLRLGMPFEDIARFKAKRGDYGPGDAEELVRSRVLRKKRGEQGREQRTLGNGRIYTLVWDPIPGGGSVTTHTDVTELRKAEREVAEKSVLLGTTFESMTQGIRVLDNDLKLAAFNRYYVELMDFPPGFIRLGMDYEEITRLNAERGVHGPVDVEDHVDKRMLERQSDKVVRRETKLPSGLVVAAKHELMPDGGTVTTYTDITERKRAEEEVAQKSSLLETTLENMSHGITVLDADLRLLAFNQKSIELRDYPPGFFRLGMPIEELYRYKAERGYYGAGDVDAQVAERMEKKGRQKSKQQERVRSDGMVVAIDRERMPDGGQVTTYTDITQHKRMEEALRGAKEQAELANRTKSEFLANMSHELRTPLNAILGFSEVMGKATFGPLGNPKYEEYAKDINDSGRHLLALIQDILDLSKIEAGKLELDEEDIDIAKAIRSCLVLVQERAENGGVKLKTDIADGLLALHADKRKLKQILVNLLSNAIKFTPAGGEVTLKAWSRPDSGYVFQVIYTGIGIALADIPTALPQFGQVDADLNRQYEGTGLGLPLTKSLVEMHGGSLDLQSEVGVGTTVTVRFPKERIVRVPEVEATGSPAA